MREIEYKYGLLGTFSFSHDFERIEPYMTLTQEASLSAIGALFILFLAYFILTANLTASLALACSLLSTSFYLIFTLLTLTAFQLNLASIAVLLFLLSLPLRQNLYFGAQFASVSAVRLGLDIKST